MGSGKGGGGGGSRAGGGGGAAATTAGGAAAAGGLQPGEKVPPYQPPWYTDLPPVANANRRVNADGEVIVGSAGALPSTNRFADTDAGMLAAEDFLINDVGIPGGLVTDLHVADSVRDIANMLPENSTYLGHGIEGVGIQVGNTRKAVRIQYDGKNPLNAYDVGRSGVYSDWKKKYGNLWVEQKEMVQYTASQARRQTKINVGEMQTKMVESFTPDARGNMSEGIGVYTNKKIAQWADVDMHSGNWGFDFAGRPRVFDQGAVRPIWDQRFTAGSR